MREVCRLRIICWHTIIRKFSHYLTALRTQSCNLQSWPQLQHIIRKIRKRLHAFHEKNVIGFIHKMAISITIIGKNDKIIDWPLIGESARIDQHAKTGKAIPSRSLFTFLQGSRQPAAGFSGRCKKHKKTVREVWIDVVKYAGKRPAHNNNNENTALDNNANAEFPQSSDTSFYVSICSRKTRWAVCGFISPRRSAVAAML